MPDAIEDKARIYGRAGKALTKYQMAINDAAKDIAKDNSFG